MQTLVNYIIDKEYYEARIKALQKTAESLVKENDDLKDYIEQLEQRLQGIREIATLEE